VQADGEEVSDLTKIRGHYLRGWFILDVLTVLPILPLTPSAGLDGASGAVRRWGGGWIVVGLLWHIK